jgi:hypothetical protein
MLQPWEQQQGESSKAFAAFCVYRDLGRNRSVVEAFRQQTGKPGAKQASGRWNRWAKAWHWAERAQAWDGEQDRVKRDTQLRKIEEMAVRHANVSLMFLQKVVDRLRTVDADTLTMADLVRWFEAAVRVERLSRGEPDSVQEQRHEGGPTSETNIMFQILSDPAAAELACRLFERVAAGSADPSQLRLVRQSPPLATGPSPEPPEPQAD